MSIPADLLDDLAVRFVLNMPDEEKNDPIRICFQMEVAFWFYIDFYCETMPNLPRLKLRKFAYIMFEHIPRLHKFLDPEVFDKVITNWIEYKFSIPCSGGVLLDKNLEYVLLVQGYGSKNWSFPKGKVNHDETLMNCAIREVLEETGYDCSHHIYENVAIDRNILESVCRLFIVTDVDMDYNFHPHVRNEIRSIQWFAVNDLPMRPVKKAGQGCSQPTTFSKFYTVYPFVPLIRKWIEKERRHRRKLTRKSDRQRTFTNGSYSEGPTAGSGSGSGDDLASSSNTVSPFTVVEDGNLSLATTVENKSTSFVDVKLDDIYADDSMIVSTNNVMVNNGANNLHEQSVVGFPVFNADSDPESGTSPKEDPHQHSKTSYPTSWQALVNAYNRSNTIHTPIGYDLMVAGSRRGGGGNGGGPIAMSTPMKGQAPPPMFGPVPSNGVIRAEDLEAAPPPPQLQQQQDGAQLHSLLGSKAMTCGDKLNFLFSMAATNQHTASSSTSASATPPPPPLLHQQPMPKVVQQSEPQQNYQHPQQMMQQQQGQQQPPPPSVDLMSLFSNGLPSSMGAAAPVAAAASASNVPAFNGLSMLFASSRMTTTTTTAAAAETTHLNVGGQPSRQSTPSNQQQQQRQQNSAAFKPSSKQQPQQQQQQQRQSALSSSSQSSKSSPFGAIGSSTKQQQLQQTFDRMLSGAGAGAAVLSPTVSYLQTSSRTCSPGPQFPPLQQQPPAAASASGYPPDGQTVLTETTAAFFAAATAAATTAASSGGPSGTETTTTTTTVEETTTTNSYGVYQLFGNRATNIMANHAQQQQFPQQQQLPQAEQQQVQPAAAANYNGLSPKVVPEVQAKIRLLIDRLKFLNGD
ncbi:mRNA-decapping enzyme subunit 2 [Tyrophagus putrescentiae]|nr:mRNA-decapping enzyme subunit 2 [Tyrophagus putrescentiae]